MEFLFINVNHRCSVSHSDSIPLSMGYILTYLRGLGHHGVILDDLFDRRLSLNTLEMWIAKLRPGVIGFTAYQDNMETIRFFSRYVKLHHKNIRILLGGPQATFLPSTALRELPDVDFICRGEGEKVTSEIAECLENNNQLSSVSGITFREGDRIIDTAPSPDLPEDLRSISVPLPRQYH